MNKKTSFIIAGVTLAIVALAGWSYARNNDPDDSKPPEQQSSSSTTPQTSQVTTTAAGSLKVPIKARLPRPTTPSARYQEAFTTYGDQGNRHIVQLDETCHGVPGTLLIKTGLKFMIDNRSEIEVSVRYEDQSFNIAAWDYRIVTAQVPGKHFLTCEGGGAAEVTVAP